MDDIYYGARWYPAPYGVYPGELNVISSSTLKRDDKIAELCKIAKELDECNVVQDDRYVIISEKRCIDMFGEEEGKKCWLELTKDLDKENVKILDPTKQDIPPWTH